MDWSVVEDIRKNRREVIKAAEAAAILGISRSDVYRRIARGEIHKLDLGPKHTMIRIPVVPFLKYCEAQLED